MARFPNSWRRWLLCCWSCLVLASCSGSVELIGALPEQEANEVLAVLLNAKIPAEKIPGKEGMVSVQVEGGKVAKALDALRARGLPRERFAGMGDVFRKDGLISSPLEERVRYVYALSQELSNTITKIDGVVTARVHVVLPERGSAGDSGTPSSAAVFVKYQEGYNLELVRPQIRQLVINSIPNLSTDKVAIVLVPAQSEAGGTSSGASGPGASGNSSGDSQSDATAGAAAPSSSAAQEGTAQVPRKPVATETVLGIEVATGSSSGLIAVLAVLTLLSLGGVGGLAYFLLRGRGVTLPGLTRTDPATVPGTAPILDLEAER